MAEQAKEAPGRKVVELSVKEGGIQLGSNGTQTTLPRNIPGVELELATNLGGVLVKFLHRQQDGKMAPRTLLVPMSHIKHLEFA